MDRNTDKLLNEDEPITRGDVLRASRVYEAAANAAQGATPNTGLDFAVFQILQVHAVALKAMAGITQKPRRIFTQ
jgi:hypothetical protein